MSTLGDLVVRQRDVPSGYVVLTIPGGDRVSGEVTLDLCEASYPSEALREDRLQTAAIAATGATALSTEAVRYRSEAATAQAFAELRASAASCRGRSVKAGADATWARTDGVERLAFTVSGSSGDPGLAVYLRRGPVLLGLYLPDATAAPMPVEGRTTIPAIVRLFEERLLQQGGGSSGGSSVGGPAA